MNSAKGHLDIRMLNNIRYQEAHHWEFYFLQIPASRPGTPFHSIVYNAAIPGLVVYQYLVQSISFNPFRSLESRKDEATGKSYFTRAGDYDDVSITFNETEFFMVQKMIDSLQALSYSKTNGAFVSGNPSIYGILVYGTKNRIKKQSNNFTDFKERIQKVPPSQVFIMQGLKLKGSQGYSSDYGSSGALSVAATFSVDEILSFEELVVAAGAGLIEKIGGNILQALA